MGILQNICNCYDLYNFSRSISKKLFTGQKHILNDILFIGLNNNSESILSCAGKDIIDNSKSAST